MGLVLRVAANDNRKQVINKSYAKQHKRTVDVELLGQRRSRTRAIRPEAGEGRGGAHVMESDREADEDEQVPRDTAVATPMPTEAIWRPTG